MNARLTEDVRLERETVWLSQMAELFGRERSVVTQHIRNVFKEANLTRGQLVQDLHGFGARDLLALALRPPGVVGCNQPG